MQLQQLCLYPIKSTPAYFVSQAIVQPQGLNFDREFMLTEPNGKMITARKDETLFRLSAFPVPFGLQVVHQDGDMLIIHYADFQQQAECDVWGNVFHSLVASSHINRWFSEKFGREVQLRWIGQQSPRRTSRSPQTPVAFADGYPLLLTSEKSLQQVQQECAVEISMANFRPNLVIDGEYPFQEESWQKIQIGAVQFLNIKPCERCVLITRDPQTHQLDRKMEPLRTLKKLNTNAAGKVIFGINLIPLNQGVIRVGDKLEVLE